MIASAESISHVSILHKCDYNGSIGSASSAAPRFQFYISAIITLNGELEIQRLQMFQFYISAIITFVLGS